MSSGSSWNSDDSEEELLSSNDAIHPSSLRGLQPCQNIVPLNSVQCTFDNNPSAVKKEKPDGGWGWVVVLGVAISNMTTQALISVFGLLFIQRLSELDIATGGASVVMGVQTTTLNLSGLAIGPLMKRFSCRQTAAVGSFLVVGGLLLTTFADSISKFIFTYSVFTGCGMGLLSPTTFVVINTYFSKRRGRAVGLAFTGTGIGQMFLPFLVDYLQKEYGFNGTLLILSGLALHAFVGALLYRPVKQQMSDVSSNGPPEEYKPETVDSTEYSEITNYDYTSTKKSCFLTKLMGPTNVELLFDTRFIPLIMGLAFVYIANTSFSMLLPFYLESAEYSRPRIALCMSVLSGADILGRLVVPVFTDSLKIRSKTVFFVGSAMSAIARSVLVSQNTYEGILIMASVTGFVRASIICNFNLSISDHVAPDKLPSALGLHMLFRGLGIMIFAPLVGFLRDYTKSYTFCIHVLSVVFLILPFLVWLLNFIFSKRRRQWNYVPA
ncbi:hypothetical protein RUM44_011652 [Polyplax serrata]|uniref:Major facilitator superfamily (MFS) profile domain-containing protein n=1 Tax=Polyplax serrata TaxID=468196 RepID=A0ABR1AQN3_POLSC